MIEKLEITAKDLRTSLHSLRLAAKSGKLPGARKIGGRWFVHRATLDAYFAQTLPEHSAPSVATVRPAA